MSELMKTRAIITIRPFRFLWCALLACIAVSMYDWRAFWLVLLASCDLELP